MRPYFPLLVFSVACPVVCVQAVTTLDDIFSAAYLLMGWLITLVLGVGVLVFVWGLVIFILDAGDEAGREAGRAKMLWGIVTLFLMVTLWGVVAILRLTFGIPDVVSCAAPFIGPDSVSSCVF